ncbi:MAG: 2-oxoacid:acceptor oxidoreductase family protein [Thermotogae bacterium]|nr:2-oxoacid:acceptor oxidoreductase family protein [Thermotogota bacterium]
MVTRPNIVIHKPQTIRIVGIGGQGSVLAAVVLAEALMMEGNWVVQSQSYGAQVRGGLSYADVLYSRFPIEYPIAETIDILYCMHEIGLKAFLNALAKNGILIIDSNNVSSIPRDTLHITKKILNLPLTKLAEELGDARIANMVGLGVLAKATKIVSMGNLVEAMKKHVRPGYISMNTKAIEKGFSAVSKSYKLREEKVGYLGRGFE